jgi:hypothetical protein
VVDTPLAALKQILNTLAFLTEPGLFGQWLYQGALTARVFLAYPDTLLLPFPLTAKTLLDKPPVHHSRRVQIPLERHRIRYVFLPTYSLKPNPIEESWAHFKRFLKRAKACKRVRLARRHGARLTSDYSRECPRLFSTRRRIFSSHQLNLKVL